MAYSQLTTLWQFQGISVYGPSHTRIRSPANSPPIQAATRHWAEFSLCCQGLSCAFNVGNHPWPVPPRRSIPCRLPAVPPDIVQQFLGRRARNHTHTHTPHWSRLPHNNGERIPWVPPVSFVGNTIIQAAKRSASSDTSLGSPGGCEQSISNALRTLTLFLQSHSRPGVPLSRKGGTSADDDPGEEARLESRWWHLGPRKVGGGDSGRLG